MVKAYSVKRLNHISKKKIIWCFGCGKRLSEMLSLYCEEPFVKRISALLDNNSLLWGKVRDIGGRQVSICQPDIIARRGNKQIILLITSDRFEEIYESNAVLLAEKGMICSQYPDFYYTYSKLLMKLCCVFSIRRQMLFNIGDEPYENSKAIVEYLIKRYSGKRYKLVFIGSSGLKGEKWISDNIVLDRNTLRCRHFFSCNMSYCYRVATSKYLFYENEPLKKVRRCQSLIYLNHGTIPLKNVKDVLQQPKELDIAVCPSEECAEIYMQQYGIPKEKLIYMIPPRDIFLVKDKHKLDRIIGDEYGQVILWLPTFRTLKGTMRKDSVLSNPLPLLEVERDFVEVNRQLRKNKQLLLIKLHPREKESFRIPQNCDCIKLLHDMELEGKNLILQEILGDTAALITDYSGISFEYLLLDRPIGYTVNDMDYYTRGFAFENPEEYMPGEKIYTVTELISFLNGLMMGYDQFKEVRNMLKDKIFQGNDQKNGIQELIRYLEGL